MQDYELMTLPNGIRVVHKQVTHTKIAHCGFILDIGSRDEKPHQQGIAHFWEHMAFKGTTKRKAYHILNRLDSVGGELNAYTTKEKICFYASVLDKHLKNAVELLTDITFDSVFPEKQIERERSVILEEMAMYHDTPEDAIQDEFEEQVFHAHPIGNNILGTQESVRSFGREDFKDFIAENLDTSRIIFSCVGPQSSKQVMRMAERYLRDLPAVSRQRQRQPFLNYRPRKEEVARSLTQSQCGIGRPSYHLTDERRLPFFLLINLLGGPGLNSRLNLALREKYGFVYSVEAGYHAFSDTGLFNIYFGTEPRQLEKSVKIVMRELQRLREKSLGVVQLHQAKEQLMGQMAMGEENNANLMLMMGKSLLDLDSIDSLPHVFEQVQKVTASQLQELAQDQFDPAMLSQLRFVPND